MAKPLIGRTVRRIRMEKGLSQQQLAVKLGISASYLNLIEHDQRSLTASLLFKLTEQLQVDLAALSGKAEQQLEVGLREAFADPLLGVDAVEDEEAAAVAAGSPNAARAVLALYRAWQVAREDSSGIALPSGRRILMPNEEARDAFHDRSNYFHALELEAETIVGELNVRPAEMNHAMAERLRRKHELNVVVGQLEDTVRRYDPEARTLYLSEMLPRESRGFHMAFQVALMECREAVDKIIAEIKPTSKEAAAMIRVGLLNYTASALLMPYEAFARTAREMRHDIESLAARFCVSFEQACHRLSSLQREKARGIPFFFLRVDPAGNVSKRFSAAGFPFARFGGSCPRWVVHSAFATPGALRVQVAELPDGATFLCFARTVTHPAPWGEPVPMHVVAMGCDIGHARELVYADGLDLAKCGVGIGLSCRLCDRENCRSRAFPPLEHRLALDPMMKGDSPYRFENKRSPSKSGR